MNNKHRKTIAQIYADPTNGNLEWAHIEAALRAIGCRVIEGAGSSVTFEMNGRKATFHRPHPSREALRYRVSAVRQYLIQIGISS